MVSKPRKRKHVARNGPRWYEEAITRLHVYFNELSGTTSDRVTVIVATSLIDRALEMLLRHFFISRGASQDDCDSLLTDGLLPPLAAFGIRIRFAKCLGLIDKDFAAALDYAKDWRNNFAHEPIPEPLTEEAARGLWALLPRQYQSALPKWCTVIKEYIQGEITPRWLFLGGCIFLDSILINQADHCFGDVVPGERD